MRGVTIRRWRLEQWKVSRTHIAQQENNNWATLLYNRSIWHMHVCHWHRILKMVNFHCSRRATVESEGLTIHLWFLHQRTSCIGKEILSKIDKMPEVYRHIIVLISNIKGCLGINPVATLPTDFHLTATVVGLLCWHQGTVCLERRSNLGDSQNQCRFKKTDLQRPAGQISHFKLLRQYKEWLQEMPKWDACHHRQRKIKRSSGGNTERKDHYVIDLCCPLENRYFTIWSVSRSNMTELSETDFQRCTPNANLNWLIVQHWLQISVKNH